MYLSHAKHQLYRVVLIDQLFLLDTLIAKSVLISLLFFPLFLLKQLILARLNIEPPLSSTYRIIKDGIGLDVGLVRNRLLPSSQRYK